MKKLMQITISFLTFSVISLAQVSELKILPGDGTLQAQFGSSVSISGDYVIVGALGDNMQGSAYIFRRNGASWIEEQKLTASDGAVGDKFGNSVSISGNYAIVGAEWDDDYGESSGSAYIFRKDGVNWIEEQKLTASDGAEGDWIGSSVSISGDYAIVGTEWGEGAYIYRRNGASWIEEQKLTASDSQFGGKVSISGNYVIVGADGIIGSAYIFRRDGVNWIEEQRITASDGGFGDFFGHSVSISGDYAIIGTDGGEGAYIFKRNGTSWIEEQKLIASDGEPGDFIGRSVSISGDYAIVGAYGDDDNGDMSGSAHIFRKNGANWIEEQKVTASDGAIDDWFGFSVSISGDYTIVGAVYDDDNGDFSGSAYIYGGFVVGVEEEKSGIPIFFKLGQNYPNPFNPNTTIKYQIPELSLVTIKVYDVLGSEITTLVNEEKPAGSYEVEFNVAQNSILSSGIYFYRLQANEFAQVKKMILLK